MVSRRVERRLVRCIDLMGRLSGGVVVLAVDVSLEARATLAKTVLGYISLSTTPTRAIFLSKKGPGKTASIQSWEARQSRRIAALFRVDLSPSIVHTPALLPEHNRKTKTHTIAPY